MLSLLAQALQVSDALPLPLQHSAFQCGEVNVMAGSQCLLLSLDGYTDHSWTFLQEGHFAMTLVVPWLSSGPVRLNAVSLAPALTLAGISVCLYMHIAAAIHVACVMCECVLTDLA